MTVTTAKTMVARRAVIAQVLFEEVIPSQAQLRLRLLPRGFEVTQATLSRDLESLGAIRLTVAGQARYEIVPATVARLEGSAGADSLTRVAAEVLVSAEPAMNIAVLHTPPGAAQYLAGPLDAAALPELVGSVAGDDTVIVVMRSEQAARDLCQMLLARTGFIQHNSQQHGEQRRSS